MFDVDPIVLTECSCQEIQRLLDHTKMEVATAETLPGELGGSYPQDIKEETTQDVAVSVS